jgi:Ser/Thr protein kinase RdoA (MazF antagonist)
MALSARGEQGRVWRLDTSTGRYAVKELTVRQVETDAAADVAYQEAVLAAGTVLMPQPLLTSSGTVLLPVADHQVRVYTWVELLPSDLSMDPALVGATVAAVHRVEHEPARPLHGWFTDPVGAAGWVQLLAAAETARAPFTAALDAEIPSLLALEQLMEAPRRLQSCHRDLWADNLLPTPSGGLCVIDWENCGLEDPAQEIPMPVFDFAGGDLRRAALLYRSYLDAGGPARVTGPGSFTMVIAQFGHFWESAVRSYLRPGADHAEQAHSLERIDELLRTPFRPHHIDDLLEVLIPLG